MHTLTTLNTPHLGNRFVDMLHNDPTLYLPDQYEGAIYSVGLSYTNIFEFITENIKAFNTVASNHPHVKYFSVGSATEHGRVSDALKYSQRMVEGSLGTTVSDGLAYWEETVWGIFIFPLTTIILPQAFFLII